MSHVPSCITSFIIVCYGSTLTSYNHQLYHGWSGSFPYGRYSVKVFMSSHMDNVFSVDFSPAEGYLALGSHDRHVSFMAILCKDGPYQPFIYYTVGILDVDFLFALYKDNCFVRKPQLLSINVPTQLRYVIIPYCYLYYTYITPTHIISRVGGPTRRKIRIGMVEVGTGACEGSTEEAAGCASQTVAPRAVGAEGPADHQQDEVQAFGYDEASISWGFERTPHRYRTCW